MEPNTRLLKIGEVIRRTAKGRSTIYRAVRAGTFPPPTKIGPRASAWAEPEVQAWIAARLGERGEGRA